jgi:phospholipase/carboxylesterase
VSTLLYSERAPAGEPEGLLILHHGRGTNEQDLLTLGDVLDPQRRLLIVTPRAPLELPGSPGFHWYLVSRVGYPDQDTFHAAYQQLAALHEELWQRTGIAPGRTILGGFSMGSAMSYALGLGAGRPAPAGILAFSGFIPTVEGWSADLDAHRAVRVFIAHGRLDAIIDVSFARDAAQRLREAGLQVDYHESEATHHIDPRQLPLAGAWLASTLQADDPPGPPSSGASAAPSAGSA